MFASKLGSQMDAPAVSVVIPTRNRAAYLAVALASLARQELDQAYEVLVVDDGSTDTTGEVVRDAGVRCVRADPPLGLNAARNTGVRMTAAPLIAFLDDDVEVPAGWLAALVEGADRHPDADAFGGPIRARLEGRAPGACGREDPPITALDLGAVDTEADMVWGANMAIRRGAFERLGPFDEAVAGHGDEEDWLRALRAAGGKIVYVAGAGVDHRRAAADAGLVALARAAYQRGRAARVSDQRRGTAPGLLREVRVLAGCGWHIVRYACPQGAVMGAHSAGRVAEAVLGGHRTTIGQATNHGLNSSSDG
jgi:GT2 family glycosyltransferase